MERGARIAGKRRPLRGGKLHGSAGRRLGVRARLHGLAPDPLADAAHEDRENDDEQSDAGDRQGELDAAGRELRAR